MFCNSLVKFSNLKATIPEVLNAFFKMFKLFSDFVSLIVAFLTTFCLFKKSSLCSSRAKILELVTPTCLLKFTSWSYFDFSFLYSWSKAFRLFLISSIFG